MRSAVAGGMVSVLGGCLPLAGKLPLLPVTDALGELSRLDGGQLLEAALGMAPQYVRAEVGRLLPQLGAGELGLGSRGEGWQQERLFSAVAELLGAVARRSGLGVVIEDVHWADSATLDCLTYLARPGRRDPLTMVVTFRSDEVPLDAQVADWLAHVRGGGGVEEIRLGPLSRAQVAEQIAGLGGPPPGRLVDDLYARAEGNPFFTEQLAAAALAEPAGDGLGPPSRLPARLAELLAARAAGCGTDAGAVLAGLAVADRPLSESLLRDVTGLDVEAVRGGLRELTAARLLAASTAEGEHRPRHALLAEAVAAGLLPGERVVLHERTARALEAAGGGRLAAEVADHWAAAGRATEELLARVAAAEAAEQVFGYAEAAVHWQRAIELCQTVPAVPAGVNVPRLYVRAVDALWVSGDSERAGAVAEEAYRRFADHPDHATAAVICQRAAYFREIDAPATGLPLIKEALRLFGQGPPSADHAEAWFVYGLIFLFYAEGRLAASLAALNRALEVAEAAGAAAVIPRCLAVLADLAFMQGQVQEGFALLHRGQALAHFSQEDAALLGLAVNESDTLLKLGKFQNATEVALRSLQAARQTGLEDSLDGLQLTDNASQALLARGRTAEAAALIDPLTTGPPDRGHRVVHEQRTEIDLLRGDIGAADGRQQQINALIGHPGLLDPAREAGQRTAELALWAGRPADAVQETRRVLALFKAPDMTIFCGRLLATGMRACAELAEQARARRDDHAAGAALAAGAGLVSWTDKMGGTPFSDHPLVATIPADRATWDAECGRLAGANDPAAWSAAAKTWEGMGCPAPGRVRVVAARRGTAHRRTAPRRRHRAASRRGRRRGPRAAARPDPRARAAGPHPPPGTACQLLPDTAPAQPAYPVRANLP